LQHVRYQPASTAVLLDLYSRRVVGLAMGQRLTVELAEQALTMALANRAPTAGLLHHSDREYVCWSPCWPFSSDVLTLGRALSGFIARFTSLNRSAAPSDQMDHDQHDSDHE
jgi:hypothetical protein